MSDQPTKTLLERRLEDAGFDSHDINDILRIVDSLGDQCWDEDTEGRQ